MPSHGVFGAMLNLRYGPVPAEMLEMMEHHAKRLGLALFAIEAIGQHLDFVETFILECEVGRGEMYASHMERTALSPVALA